MGMYIEDQWLHEYKTGQESWEETLKNKADGCS